jgi:hypothetical protein
MADISEFAIPSAILAAELVRKSELSGRELEAYAVDIHRLLMESMSTFKKKKEAAPS